MIVITSLLFIFCILFSFGCMRIINIYYKRKLKKIIVCAKLMKKFAELENEIDKISKEENLEEYPNIKKYLDQPTYILDVKFGDYESLTFYDIPKEENGLMNEIFDIQEKGKWQLFEVIKNISVNISILYKLKYPIKATLESIKKI